MNHQVLVGKCVLQWCEHCLDFGSEFYDTLFYICELKSYTNMFQIYLLQMQLHFSVFCDQCFLPFGVFYVFILSIVDNVLLIVRESLEIFFCAEFGISIVNSREQSNVFSFAFLDAFLHASKFTPCNSFQGLCRVGRFSDSRENVPGGGQRAGSLGSESSDS